MTCPKCGSYVSSNLDICPFCNTKVNENIEEAKTVPFIVADDLSKDENDEANVIIEDIFSSTEAEKQIIRETAPKSSFDPNSYPVIDPTEFEAYKTVQRAAKAEKQQEEQSEADEFINMEYEDVIEEEFFDDGPEIIGLNQASSKAVKNDKPTFALGVFFKNAVDKASDFFKKLFGKKDKQKGKSQPNPANYRGEKGNLKNIGMLVALICIIVGIAIVFIVSVAGIANAGKNSKSDSKFEKMFPAIYYDSGKLVLLESDSAENRNNIASSGIDGTENVQYFAGAKRAYYVKNNDLYTYNLKNNESMRIIRNVDKYAPFDSGKKAVASAQDGKIYYFNGKEVSSIAKDNDEVTVAVKFPLIFGNGSENALFMDKYDSATGSAEVYRISGNGKPKLIAEIQNGTTEVEYYNGIYLLIADDFGVAEIYDTDGKVLLEIEDYNSSVALGESSILISHRDGSLGIFDGEAETIFDADVASVIAVSDSQDSFAYYDSANIAYLYKDGKHIEICDATYFTSLVVDMDTYQVLALEDDILTVFNLKSSKYKEKELGDGVERIEQNKITGQWTAYGFDTVYQITDDELIELYSGTKQMPVVSADGKKVLLINQDKELIEISKGDEKVIAEGVQTFFCDANCKDILLITDDKLYCNTDDNKITSLRDVTSFQIIYPMD